MNDFNARRDIVDTTPAPATGSHRLPAPLGRLLGRLPAYPGSLLFAAALNLALAPHLRAGALDALGGKTLRLRVLDAGLAFDFGWRRGAFHAIRNGGAADLSIGASAHDFLLLAQRREDPDTLFFGRRLLMEGDTELGLLVKNTLDAMDLSVFERAGGVPGRLLARLRGARADAQS